MASDNGRSVGLVLRLQEGDLFGVSKNVTFTGASFGDGQPRQRPTEREPQGTDHH